MDCEGVNACGELGREHRVDHAMALEPTLSFEGRSDDMHPEMGLTPRPMSGMAHVRLRFIVDPEVQGRKSGRKLADDPILKAHNGSLKARAAVTVNHPAGIELEALQVWCRCKHNKAP